MSAVGDRLRRAAEMVEQMAAEATIAPWVAESLHWAHQNVRGRVASPKLRSTTRVGVANATEADAAWIALMGPQIAQPIVLWLRSEAVRFEHDDRRGSPYGYPSWHFASTVLGEDPSDGGFDTLPTPEATS